jgi:hypothetical protein
VRRSELRRLTIIGPNGQRRGPGSARPSLSARTAGETVGVRQGELSEVLGQQGALLTNLRQQWVLAELAHRALHDQRRTRQLLLHLDDNIEGFAGGFEHNQLVREARNRH